MGGGCANWYDVLLCDDLLLRLALGVWGSDGWSIIGITNGVVCTCISSLVMSGTSSLPDESGFLVPDTTAIRLDASKGNEDMREVESFRRGQIKISKCMHHWFLWQQETAAALSILRL